MHSSMMHTAHSLTVSPYLVVSHAWTPKQPCPPPRSNHPCPMAATTHAPPEATMHTPWSNYAHPPEQPCMPPRATLHAPRSNHACPPEQPHMPPGATMHAPQSKHACPPTPSRATTHTTPSPVNRITDRCKNITFANYVCGR